MTWAVGDLKDYYGSEDLKNSVFLDSRGTHGFRSPT